MFSPSHLASARWRPALLAATAATLAACASSGGGATPTATPLHALPADARGTTGVVWRADFDRAPDDFVSPSGASPAAIARVYTAVAARGGEGFLMARHDAIERADVAAAPAVHYGHAFGTPPRLAASCILSWRWRVLRHPAPEAPWDDLAASVYVVVRRPTLLRSGRGFKLGWLSAPGPSDTRQHGLVQIPLEDAPAGPRWRRETVDLCALYRRYYGDVGDARVLYVGVMTDADDSDSVAAADYADLTLRARTPVRPRHPVAARAR